jgi:hypothetical protein
MPGVAGSSPASTTNYNAGLNGAPRFVFRPGAQIVPPERGRKRGWASDPWGGASSKGLGTEDA